MPYGKLWDSLYTGSMVGAGLNVLALWPYVIANAKPPGMVELNPKLLAVTFGCSVEEVRDAIKKLCDPDPESRTKEFEGRRLLPEGQFLYRIPTWEKYNAMRNELERRESNRLAAKRYRERKNDVSADARLRHQESAESAHVDVHGDVDVQKKQKRAVARRVVVERPEDVTEKTWGDWVGHRRLKRAGVTASVVENWRKRATAAGMSLDDAMAYSVAQGHMGFFPPKASNGKPMKPATHIQNMPLGASGCSCPECVQFRAKKVAP